VGYHESVAGDLDRARLDALAPERPARIQHRSGALWMLNSVAIERLRLDAAGDVPGLERDRDGRPTGRVYRLDAWLRERIGAQGLPDLAPVGRLLASFGVTAVTDATASNGPAELHALVSAVERGALPQRLCVMGRHDLPDPGHARVSRGAVKLVLDEAELPPCEAFEDDVRRAHAAGRAVAVHCVTRTELVFALAGIAAAGARRGDRIEHAAVAPPDLVARTASLGLTVVTQPHFIRERGDAYAREVEPRDRPWLYRARAFVAAGVPLLGGSDAPFGSPNPWLAVSAAIDRRSESGLVLGPDEALDPARALALFAAPGALAVGDPGDLCLLGRPWCGASLAADETPTAIFATPR
jgi:predicted amidohydrolase YtcJ